MPKSPDGRVWAIRKSDPSPRQKFRWPAHLVEQNDDLDYAPAEKRRVREPEPNTTTKTVRATEPKKES